MALRRKNHYVACVYLKRFSPDLVHVFTYRILVVHRRVPLWKRDSIKGVAYQKHLYTRIISGVDSNGIETWLDHESKHRRESHSGGNRRVQLAETDWRRIIRFSLHKTRVLRHASQVLSHLNETMPTIFQECVEGAVQKLEEARRSGKPITALKFPNSEILPIRVRTETKPEQGFGTIKAETIVGRSAWLFNMKHLLSRTANILQNHKWTILRPPVGISWFTSDNPVVRLNYYCDQQI